MWHIAQRHSDIFADERLPGARLMAVADRNLSPIEKLMIWED
jgi:hypothetical protein